MQKELKKESVISKLNKYSLYIAILLLVVGGTYEVTNLYFNNQSKIIYSLDKKENDKEIIKIIDSADKYVYFAIYTFTLDDVAQALARAKRRGLIVWGITDAGQDRQDFQKNITQELRNAGVTIETQKHTDGIMHIKAVITDKAYAMGSYNWTTSATVANDEILEIGTNKFLHDRYFEIIKKILLANQ